MQNANETLKKLAYLFIKGKVPSLLRLRLGPDAARFAGSENIILSMVHVVETFGSNKKERLLAALTVSPVSASHYSSNSFTCVTYTVLIYLDIKITQAICS